MRERVGFIGLGAIGRPMAVHIAQTFETMVWNRTAERARSFIAEHGARAAETPVELVRWADVVITCLPTSSQVRAIVEAAAESWRQGQLLVDTTSGDPAEARSIAHWLEERGVGFVDAPVSGGTNGAEAGTLTVMLGGGEELVERARHVVAPFAGQTTHIGPVGTGHAVKAINQALLAVNIQVAGEGLAALCKLGVNAEIALAVINSSSGRSNVSENLISQRVVTRAWPRTFRLALLDKDVGIALRVLEDTGTPHETVAVVKRAFAAAREVLGEEADHVEFIREVERAAGVEIQ